jgi:hypothetical protein
VFLLVDHQTGVFQRVVKAPPADEVEMNVAATALGHDISLRRLEQEGVSLTTTASVVSELAGEYPKLAEIMHAG